MATGVMSPHPHSAHLKSSPPVPLSAKRRGGILNIHIQIKLLIRKPSPFNGEGARSAGEALLWRGATKNVQIALKRSAGAESELGREVGGSGVSAIIYLTCLE